jgi:hypothetical protein
VLIKGSLPDYSTKIKLATELRDNADSLYQRDHDYRSFVEVLLPAFMTTLEKGKVSLSNQAPEHVSSRRIFCLSLSLS